MYDYDAYLRDIERTKDIDRYICGTSTMGLPIYAYHVGDYSTPQALVHGGIHGREYLTTRLLFDLMPLNVVDYGIWYVPLVNPDGFRIATSGVDWIQDNNTREWLRGLSRDFVLWKANARGVDLNVNFPAGFGEGSHNIYVPHYENYVGEYPLSERESKALYDLTLKVHPIFTLSYHLKGEVVYYGYREYEGYSDIAQDIGRDLGYSVETTPTSAGGYKDWYLTLGIGAGVTIEVGEDRYSHPYPEDKYIDIYNKNKCIPQVIPRYIRRIYDRLYGQSHSTSETR